MNWKKSSALLLASLCSVGSVMAQAPVPDYGWDVFTIRNASAAPYNPPVIQDNDDLVTDSIEFFITESGQKAALGTNMINGARVDQIATLHIDRLDDYVNSTAPYGPYFNIWVTDGLGNYAVIANEPSNPAWIGSRWDVPDWTFLSTKVAKVYETPGWNDYTSWVHNLVGVNGALTFADVAALTIAPPPAAYITNPANAVGSGAPDDINENTAYGYNWIFGDTANNYVSGNGYIVDNYYATTSYAVHNVTQDLYYSTVHAAVAGAVENDLITVANGVYPFTSTLNIPVGITIDGESEEGVIFAVDCGAGYGIHPSVGGITLRDFTLSIPETSTQSGFIVHASGTPSVQDGLTVENVTIQGSGAAAQRRAGLDVHGYDNVSLSNVSSNDATWGNGIQITGCSDVTVENCSTSNNAWGSLAIYCSQYLVPTRASSDVTINGDNCVFGESNVFIENEFGLTCSGITVTGYEYEMRNTTFRTGAENFIFLKDTWADCAALAAAFVGYEDATTVNEIATGNFIVDAALSLTIQAAIDAANSGDTIEVDAGSYDENVILNKALTLNGANANAACDARVAESVIAPASGLPVSITADGVSLNGFEVTAPGYQYGIILSGTSDVAVIHNNVHDINSSATPVITNTYGIYYSVPNVDANSNVTISDNCLDNIASSSLTGNSCAAIGVLQSTSTGTLSNLTIAGNTITDVAVNTGAWPTGKIAYGMILNTGSANYLTTTGKIVDAIIEDNVIDGLSGFISTAIGLEGNTENAFISGNTIANLYGAKTADRAGGGYDLNGLKFESNRYVGTVTVENNSIDRSTFNHNGTMDRGYAVANYVPVGDAYAGGTTAAADVTCTWFGSADITAIADAEDLTGSILNKIGAETAFVPFLIDSDIANPTCTGGLVAHNTTQGTDYATIQEAIDAANSGDTITLDAVTFEPVSQVQVNKSISLIGAGSANTTIDVGGFNAWGIYVSASDVTLQGFTLLGDSVANEQYGLHANPGISNLTYTDITATGTKRTAIDLNGVDGAVLTDIVANDATSGFGFAISSSRNVTVTNLSCTGNAWGAVGVFPANTPYQLPGLEEPTAITFAGTLSLDGGAGAISVQDGALASGGTWKGTISTNPADNADVTVPATFSHVVHSTRIDGLVMHNATTQATAYTMAPTMEAWEPVGTFSGTYIQDIVNGDLEVIPGLRVEAAVNGAAGGEDINIAAGTYTLLAQSLLDVDVNLLGAGSDLTFLEAGYNTGTSAYSETSALLHVAAGVTAEIRDMSISGAGFTVNQAIQSRGDSLTVADCVISNVSSSAGSFDGRGIVFLTGGGLVDGCTLSDIHRIGVHIRGAVVSPAPVVLVDGLTYTGKGDGDWLDYGVEFGGGGQGEVRNSMITACTGVASTDGSTSGGILVTDYYGTFTIAEINDCTLTANTTGVVVGYAAADISDVTIRGCSIYGNTEFGVTSTGVEVDALSNWWGAASGPYHPTTNALGAGNEVSDNVLFDPWLAGEFEITQTASETLISVADGAQYTDETVVTYSIAPVIPGATPWRQVTVWVAWDGAFVTPTSLSSLFSHADGVFFDYDLGANPMEVSVSILGGLTEGQLADTDLFTVTFDGIDEPASPFTTDLAISSAVVRSLVNVTIPSATDDALSLTVDGTAPAAITDAWLGDSCVNSDIAGTITPIDNVELYNVEYQILPGGSWAEALPANLEGASLAPQNYTVDVSGLSDGDYTLQFRVNDEVGYIGAVAEYSFHLDTVAPTAASALDADPGHEFVDLAWEHGSGHDGYKVYRALRAGYPYPGAGETTANVYGTDTFTLVADLAANVNVYVDAVAERGIYDYAVVAYDCVNDDAAAAIGAATNYFLGDWADHNGFVFSPDLAELSTSYGADAGEAGFDAEHDVAPTSDYSSYGLPEPDARINFEDLIIFAMNYGPAGPALPMDSHGNQPGDTIELVQGEDHHELLLPALVKGVSVRIACEAALQSVISAQPAFFYHDGEAWVVDVVALGGTIPANSRVELVFAGEAAQPVILDADARDAWNSTIELSIENSLSAELPLAFELGQNFPNPFNPATQIRFALPEDASVRLVLFNSLGQQVRTVLDASLEAGYHEVRLDASGLASGVYFYRMEAGNFTDLKKMVVLK